MHNSYLYDHACSHCLSIATLRHTTASPCRCTIGIQCNYKFINGMWNKYTRRTRKIEEHFNSGSRFTFVCRILSARNVCFICEGKMVLEYTIRWRPPHLSTNRLCHRLSSSIESIFVASFIQCDRASERARARICRSSQWAELSIPIFNVSFSTEIVLLHTFSQQQI